MKLALHTIICCCVFTSVLPLTHEERNTSLTKRIIIWLQNHTKRDPSSILLRAKEWPSDIHGKDSITMSPASSFGLNIRTKRSVSPKTTGCSLGTCVYHDLLDELYRINKKPKYAKVPLNKMGSDGFGRRRRSLIEASRRTGRQRQSSGAGQQGRRHKRRRAVA